MSKKGENIYKRKDNRWEGRYIRSKRLDGTAQFGYCYAKSYKEVKEKLLKAKTEGSASRKRDDINDVIFTEICNAWLSFKKAQIKESSFVKYNQILQKHIIPQLGKLKLKSIDQELINNFSRQLISEKGLAPKSAKDTLNLLGAILKYAHRHQKTLTDIEIIYPQKGSKPIRVLTVAEQNELLKLLNTNTDLCKFGIILAMMTGLRIGELCALKWKNIRFENKTVLIDKTMQRIKDLSDNAPHKTKIIISEPKSSNSVRIIPLTDFMTELCRTYYGDNPEAYILTGKTDRYIEPRVLQKRFSDYARQLNFEGVHFHTLRHSFATRCVEVDFEIKTLSEILGHSSPKVTLERYVHSSLQFKRNNMEKLSAIGF